MNKYFRLMRSISIREARSEMQDDAIKSDILTFGRLDSAMYHQCRQTDNL